MENYRKARTVELPVPCPFAGLPADTPEVRVRDGSKIRNLMGFAVGRMEAEVCRQILFSGAGRSAAKAITCAEILKRRVRGLHQCTRLQYRTLREAWEPLEPSAGLDSLTVSRSVPAVSVLLSKDPLDGGQPGYQAPGSFDTLWARAAREEEEEGGGGEKEGGGPGAGGGPGQRRKRGAAARGKGGSGRRGGGGTGGGREYPKKSATEG